jgi:hypothetical protein
MPDKTVNPTMIYDNFLEEGAVSLSVSYYAKRSEVLSVRVDCKCLTDMRDIAVLID